MKKNKGVIGLLVLTLALALYAYFGEYKREENESKRKEEQSQVLKFKKEQIQKIILQTKNETLTLTRSPDGWTLSGAVTDEADNDEVERLVEQLSNEKIVDRVSQKSESSLTEYGLSPSAGTLTFEDNLGTKQVIEISSRKNFENLQYLRRDQEPDIFTSGDSWLSFLTKPAASFRNLKLLRTGLSKVSKITLNNSNGTMQLMNQAAQWQSVEKPKLILDQNLVRELLLQISQARATGLETQAPKGKKLMSLELSGDGLKWKSDFYLDEKSKDLLAQIENPKLILRLGPQTLEKARDLRVFDLMDKTLPFDFDKSKVVSIEWSSGLKSQGLKKTKGLWWQEPKDPQFVVNDKSGELLLDKLRNLKVYRYWDKPPQRHDFKNHVTLRDQDNKVLYTLKWTQFKEHEAWAQSTSYSEIFQMDDAQLNRLGLSDIIQSNPAKDMNGKN